MSKVQTSDQMLHQRWHHGCAVSGSLSSWYHFLAVRSSPPDFHRNTVQTPGQHAANPPPRYHSSLWSIAFLRYRAPLRSSPQQTRLSPKSRGDHRPSCPLEAIALYGVSHLFYCKPCHYDPPRLEFWSEGSCAGVQTGIRKITVFHCNTDGLWEKVTPPKPI